MWSLQFAGNGLCGCESAGNYNYKAAYDRYKTYRRRTFGFA
jgi:hypothetical protein